MLVWKVRLQLLFGDVAHVLVRMLLAGIVDEDVEAAQLGDRAGDGLVAKALVAHVSGDRDRPAALALDDLAGLLRIVMLAQIDDRDVRAFAGDRARRPRGRCRCRRR